MARTFLVTLHYDGGQFAGWQRQAKGRTVRAEIEQVLERITAGAVRVHAAGRTDAGVHALGMAASCSMPDRWDPTALRRALNSLLAPERSVTRGAHVSEGVGVPEGAPQLGALARRERHLAGDLEGH